MAVLIGIGFVKDHKGAVKKAALVLWVLLLIMPFLLTGAVHRIIALKNQSVYGVGIVNELSEGAFSDAMKAVYAADTEEELPDNVTVPKAKLLKLYTYSPSLNELSDAFMEIWDQWDSADRHPGDGEIEGGWFFWAFRKAAQRSGYHSSLQKSQEFYGKIAEELNSAHESGSLQMKRKTPMALLAPIRPEYI